MRGAIVRAIAGEHLRRSFVRAGLCGRLVVVMVMLLIVRVISLTYDGLANRHFTSKGVYQARPTRASGS